MRLIDADKLREEFEFCDLDGNFIAFGSLDKASDLWFEIDEQPTIDAVEVVRCKDCCFKETSECAYRFPQQVLRNEKEEFCSYGKRKDGEQE